MIAIYVTREGAVMCTKFLVSCQARLLFENLAKTAPFPEFGEDIQCHITVCAVEARLQFGAGRTYFSMFVVSEKTKKAKKNSTNALCVRVRVCVRVWYDSCYTF